MERFIRFYKENVISGDMGRKRGKEKGKRKRKREKRRRESFSGEPVSAGDVD